MAQLQFNVEDAPEDEGFELIPDGEYSAQVIQSEMKETSTGGMMLAIRIQILEEPYQGRIVFQNFNLVNKNETAVSIAKRELAQLCVACGLDEVEDSEELHNIEFVAKIGTQAAKGDYPASNKVSKYLPAE